MSQLLGIMYKFIFPRNIFAFLLALFSTKASYLKKKQTSLCDVTEGTVPFTCVEIPLLPLCIHHKWGHWIRGFNKLLFQPDSVLSHSSPPKEAQLPFLRLDEKMQL